LDFLKIFSKIYKGEEGETQVLTSITKLLNSQHSGEENYYIIPKATIKDINGSREIDLLLLHPVFGLYVIEVKNWDSLEYMNTQNNPFKQVNEYQDLILSVLNKEFKNIPINIEYRVIFPSILKSEANEYFSRNPYYANYINHVFFKEHLEDKDIFKRFFNSSSSAIPNKKTFSKIASLFVPTDTIESGKNKIIPIITKDEIVFFDQKQLSILNGYNGGFRIIRGVAGTGKTIILTNFVNNRLQEDNSEKFLILCFNRNLVDATKSSFGEEFRKRNIAILSIMELIDKIEFNYEKVGIDPYSNIEEKYKVFETDKALKEFREKFSARLKKKPIDYFLCDETQDMPAGFMRIIYEEIYDCIFFIDEAQKFYPYTMDTIGDVFHHKSFEKLSMRGRVKNLKNVYRTPSNIAKTAFKILSHDKALNSYYKKSFYLKNGFTQDINLVLEDGVIEIGRWDDFENLTKLLLTLPKNKENVVLAYTKKSLKSIELIIKNINASSYIKVMTMQSVKGLEAQNIVIHNFGKFLYNGIKHNNDIIYRQLYVLLTRAQENIYISMCNDNQLESNIVTNSLYKILLEAHTVIKVDSEIKENKEKEKSEFKLAKLKPVLAEVKESTDFIVSASELFGIIGGLFAM